MPYENPSRERGIPDALLLGLIAFLLGLALLVWSSTGLSALLAHGSWPEGISFAHTPEAMSALMREPHDLAGAWPNTPRQALSGWGLFWGVFIGQLMVLLTLTLAAMTRVARWRSHREEKRRTRHPTPHSQQHDGTNHPHPPKAPNHHHEATQHPPPHDPQLTTHPHQYDGMDHPHPPEAEAHPQLHKPTDQRRGASQPHPTPAEAPHGPP
ncbi:type VI secretion protein, partial [Streptomyces polyrhachis]